MTTKTSDHTLELQILRGMCDLSSFDMREARAFVDKGMLNGDDFTNPQYRHAFEAVSRCIAGGVPAYAENILREVKEVPNPIELVAKITGGSDGPFVEKYAESLRDVTARRNAIVQCEAALARLRSGSDVLDTTNKLAGSVTHLRGKRGFDTFGKFLRSTEEHIGRVNEGLVSPVLSTGIPELDETIGGWQPTLNLVGAIPGVGKSALFATSIYALTKAGHKVALFSLEDPPEWLAWRILSAESGVDQFTMRFQRMAQSQSSRVIESRRALAGISDNMCLLDGSDRGMRVEDIVATSNDLVINQKVEAIFIDHLGEVHSSGGDRYDLEVARHLSLLRGIANRHAIPVVVASHLKRKDTVGPPHLSDFANSSGAERKARVALGLTRQPGSDMLEIHVLKQTNGPAGGVVQVKFNGAAAMLIEVEGGINGQRKSR